MAGESLGSISPLNFESQSLQIKYNNNWVLPLCLGLCWVFYMDYLIDPPTNLTRWLTSVYRWANQESGKLNKLTKLAGKAVNLWLRSLDSFMLVSELWLFLLDDIICHCRIMMVERFQIWKTKKKKKELSVQSAIDKEIIDCWYVKTVSRLS